MRTFWITASVFVLGVFTLPENLWAYCPYCGVTPPSLAEQVDSYDVVVLGKFRGGKQPDREKEFSGTTNFEIAEFVKGEIKGVKKGEILTHDRYRHSEEGDLVLLMGNKESDIIKWGVLLDMTPESYEYMANAPNLRVPTQQRLVYFLNFLEHPNSVIAADAFSEFAVSPYKDIVPLTPLMDRKKIRSWLENPEEPADRVVRTGFYGLLLGLCGNESDAEFLETKLLKSSEDYRFGIDGMTSGYILLSGKSGFDVLERELISNPESSQTEIFQVLQSLRFVWTYDRERLPREELYAAMRSVLQRSEVADLAIIDLARWKDWQAMDQIVSLYHKEGFNDPPVKKAIIRFLMAANGSSSKGEEENLDHVEKAERYLARFKKEDPKLFRQVERYFFE